MPPADIPIPPSEREPDRPERDRDDIPDTPPTEPDPVPIQEPPDAPGGDRPYIA